MKIIFLGLCFSTLLLSAHGVQAKYLQVTSKVYKSNCEVAFFQDGSPVTVVNIGTATLNAAEKGPEIYITMKPTDKYEQNCLEQSARITEVAWTGNLGSKGIVAQSGDLRNSGAYLELLPLNDQKKRPVTNAQGRNILHFDPDLLISEGHQYKLQLVGGKKAGAFYSAIAWAVSFI
ncbi:hypothetical protein QA364_RS17815 [Escherichia coli]|nr:hypothetical protein [Escherichia coli]EES0968048.1 hypothetical protein [Escherichia coli]EEW0818703.1 hypothetical protein [Escherichia coli]EFI4367777.1 hypothetical protein [Escherichia coli]EFJ1843065.1 hypothetical protein [Escherichia coli]